MNTHWPATCKNYLIHERPLKISLPKMSSTQGFTQNIDCLKNKLYIHCSAEHEISNYHQNVLYLSGKLGLITSVGIAIQRNSNGLDQCCPIELSTEMEMLYIYAVQYGSH